MIRPPEIEQFLDTFDSVVWSPSRLGAWHQCPRSWLLTYVYKIRPGNYDAFTGSLVHQIFEDYYDRGRDLCLPLDVIRDTMVRKFIIGQKKNPFYVPHWRRKGEQKIITSLGQFLPNDNITHTERTLRFDYQGRQFMSILDYEEGPHWHGDYKSKWSNEKYLNQQYMYMYAKQVNGDSVKGFKCVEYKNELNTLEFKLYKRQMKITLAWVEDTIKAIRTALESNDFPAKPEEFFCKQLCKKIQCEHSK